MTVLLKTVEQQDQDRPLFCEICGDPTKTIFVLADVESPETIRTCQSCYDNFMADQS